MGRVVRLPRVGAPPQEPPLPPRTSTTATAKAQNRTLGRRYPGPEHPDALGGPPAGNA